MLVCFIFTNVSDIVFRICDTAAGMHDMGLLRVLPHPLYRTINTTLQKV